MKTLSVLILTFLLLIASPAYAVDKVKKGSDSSKTKKKQNDERKQYQNFIDVDNNGIDDQLEKSVKNSTKIKPKPEQESTTQQPTESLDKKESEPDTRKSDKVEKIPVSTEKDTTDKK